MESQEIKKIAESSLKSIQVSRGQVDRDYLNRYLSSVADSRKFFNDLCSLSIGITGLIVPILISQKIPVDEVFLFTSVIFFSIEIILWVILRFYIIKKEIEKWPIEKKKVDEKYETTINDLQQLISNPTPEKFAEKQKIILGRYGGNEDNKKGLFNNFKQILFNIEYWLLGLFLVAFFLFIFSFKPLLLKILAE